MSGEGSFNQEIEKFAKATLPASDAEDVDILAFVKLVGMRLIQGKQNAEENRNSLKQLFQDADIIDKFIVYFSTLKGKYEEEQRLKKESAEKAKIVKQTTDGKIVINKSESDAPAIYKEVEDKRNKHRNQHYEQRHRQRKYESRQGDKKYPSKPQKSYPPQKAENTETNAPRTEQRQEQGEQKQKVPLPDLQGKSKCKFFPFCTNENCEFFHPSQKCPKFPRCRFKEHCLFMHEACKFGESCTRSDCFYDHPLKSRKSANPLADMLKMMMAANNKTMKPKRTPRAHQEPNQN